MAQTTNAEWAAWLLVAYETGGVRVSWADGAVALERHAGLLRDGGTTGEPSDVLCDLRDPVLTPEDVGIAEECCWLLEGWEPVVQRARLLLSKSNCEVFANLRAGTNREVLSELLRQAALPCGGTALSSPRR
eukprot:Sspe_Gene.109470::Locus_89614_Transcript_1_1_Confidence_1.000_Length_396::g.109470::m.109470